MLSDNTGLNIRLVCGVIECDQWDDITVDSQLDVPADAFSLTLFNKAGTSLPESIKGGAACQLYCGRELVLTGIIDQVNESGSISGLAINVSGRDLAGQLLDCSIPIKSTQQVTLFELLQEFILKAPLGQVINNFIVQDNSFLNNKISVEPGESFYDTIAKAAAVTGQFIWFEPRGALVIGDPFKSPYQVKQSIRLMRAGIGNNAISLDYREDVSGVFNEIKILSQDANGMAVLAEGKSNTPYAFNRLKILTLGDIENAAEAQAALYKIQHDNDLEAYTLTAVVSGWLVDGKCWQQGWEVNVQTDVLPRANARWVVLGRTFRLSRRDGKTTVLQLKRKGDWVQPLPYKEPEKKKTADTGLDEDGRGIYQGESE